MPKTYSKYRNKPIEVGGDKFDSKKEFARYQALKALKKANKEFERVIEIKRQVPFNCVVNGHKICTWKADFVVTYADGRTEVEDVKAYDNRKRKFISTPTFKLKKKLVEALYDIEIKLV